MIRFHRTLVASAATLALLGTAPVTIFASTSGAQKPAPASRVTRDQDNLWNLAAPYERGMRVTRQQWMVAVLRRNPDAFLLGNMHRLRIGVTLDLPTEEEAAAENLAAAEALIEKHFSAQNSTVAMPVLPLPPGARPRGDAATQTGTAAPAAPATPPAPMAPAASAPAPAPAPAPVPEATPAPPVAAPASAPVAAPAPVLVAPPASAPAAAASAPEVPASAPAAPPTAPVAPAEPAASSAMPPAPAASGPVVKDVPSWRRWLPHGLAACLGLLVLGLVWRARSRGTNLGEAASTFFQDTIQLIGKSKPKVITVSQAGAEVARSVERLSSTARLVRAAEEAPQAEPATPDEQEATIKLEVARAQIEIGRKDAAIAMLRAVVREGSTSQRQAAQQLLGQLGAA